MMDPVTLSFVGIAIGLAGLAANVYYGRRSAPRESTEPVCPEPELHMPSGIDD